MEWTRCCLLPQFWWLRWLCSHGRSYNSTDRFYTTWKGKRNIFEGLLLLRKLNSTTHWHFLVWLHVKFSQWTQNISNIISWYVPECKQWNLNYFKYFNRLVAHGAWTEQGTSGLILGFTLRFVWLDQKHVMQQQVAPSVCGWKDWNARNCVESSHQLVMENQDR